MKFHPVISIFLGVIVSVILYLIALSVFGVIGWIEAFIVIPGSSWFGTLLLIISYILGGFIATYLAKEKKIQYGLYEGIIIILIFISLSIPHSILDANVLLFSLIFYCILVILLAVTGGMIGLLTDKTHNRFSPLLAIIAGSAIGTSITVMLSLIISNYPDSYYLEAVNIIIGVISFLIGGFISTLLAKEKKIQYGVYTGVIILIIGIIQTSINNFPVVIHISKFIVYIISAAIGGYLAIFLAKHLKNKHITKNSL